jgi:hypothetical protein
MSVPKVKPRAAPDDGKSSMKLHESTDQETHTPAKAACRLQRKPSRSLSRNSHSLGWRGTSHPLLTYTQVLAASKELNFRCQLSSLIFSLISSPIINQSVYSPPRLSSFGLSWFFQQRLSTNKSFLFYVWSSIVAFNKPPVSYCCCQINRCDDPILSGSDQKQTVAH